MGGSTNQATFSNAMRALPRLETGEELVNHFACNKGGTTGVKFGHCNRAETGDLFRPYDLVVVPESKVRGDVDMNSNTTYAPCSSLW